MPGGFNHSRAVIVGSLDRIATNRKLIVRGVAKQLPSDMGGLNVQFSVDA